MTTTADVLAAGGSRRLVHVARVAVPGTVPPGVDTWAQDLELLKTSA